MIGHHLHVARRSGTPCTGWLVFVFRFLLFIKMTESINYSRTPVCHSEGVSCRWRRKAIDTCTVQTA